MTSKDKKDAFAERGKQLALTRSAARLAAVQALYQWEVAGGKPEAIVREFADHRLKFPKDPLDPGNRRIEILLQADAG